MMTIDIGLEPLAHPLQCPTHIPLWEQIIGRIRDDSSTESDTIFPDTTSVLRISCETRIGDREWSLRRDQLLFDALGPQAFYELKVNEGIKREIKYVHS